MPKPKKIMRGMDNARQDTARARVAVLGMRRFNRAGTVAPVAGSEKSGSMGWGSVSAGFIALALVMGLGGAVTLSLGENVDTRERQEATRLAVDLTHAAETALLTGVGATFSWEPGSYRIGDGDLTKLESAIGTAPGQYRIAPDPMPDPSRRLRLLVGTTVVVFDGARAFLLPDAS